MMKQKCKPKQEALERLPVNIQQALLIVTAVIKRIQKQQESETEDIQSR